MTCSTCGYMMGPFDKQCPRCENLPPKITPIEPPGPIVQAPVATVHVPPILPASLMLCPACNNSMSRTAHACPHCGESFEPTTEKKVIHIVLILWAVLNTFCCIYGLVNGVTLFAVDPNMRIGSFPLLGIAIGVFLIAYPFLWWMIARNYGRKIQCKR